MYSPKEQEKQHTHNLILLQTPLWVIPVLLVMQTGVLRSWTDIEYLIFSLTVASPSIVLPAFLCKSDNNAKTPYWVKLNIWIFILVAFGTYFGTHYFFDLMGMRYTFGANCRWHLESDILGQHGNPRQIVPLFMYPLTHAYFMTYFCLLVVLEEGILGVISCLSGGRKAGRVVGGLVVLGLGYGLAFAETYVMASPLLEDLFLYEDRGRMLRVGSLGYASYFVVGLPMVKRIDDGEGGEWDVKRVVIEGLGTCMGILVLLEVWAKVIGPLQ